MLLHDLVNRNLELRDINIARVRSRSKRINQSRCLFPCFVIGSELAPLELEV